jgi:hypothetical protein
MKTYVFPFIAIILLLSGCKAKDPLVKQAQQAEDKMWHDKAVQALNDLEFVLEADRITFKYGRFTYVNSNTNFISVHGDRATIQMAFNSPYAGPNGIGGITVDGMVSNVKVNADKKGNITYSMSVQGTAVSADVRIWIPNGSNRCDAEVNPTFNSGRISFSGNMYSEEDSNVYKGRAL